MAIDHNAAIARILIAKPDATLSEVRRMVPQVSNLNDHDLDQKLAFLRRHKGRLATPKPNRRK